MCLPLKGPEKNGSNSKKVTSIVA